MGYYIDNYGNRKKFKQGDTIACRYLKEGAYIIVAKTSVYNKISSTYDGRHSNMNDEQFYEYMQKMKASFNSM